MKKALLFVLIGAVLSGGPRPARADPTRGPFQVMVRVSSEAAEVWWTDYQAGRCVTCRSPRQAAVLLDEVERALGGRFHDSPRYLILVESLRSHWPRAWVFYPSSDETPAYVMRQGGVGSGAAPLRWDAWQPATSRMEEIILEATEANPPPTVAEGSDQTGADEPARARGIVIAVVVLTAVVAGLGVVRRGGWLHRWGRQRVDGTKPRSLAVPETTVEAERWLAGQPGGSDRSVCEPPRGTPPARNDISATFLRLGTVHLRVSALAFKRGRKQSAISE